MARIKLEFEYRPPGKVRTEIPVAKWRESTKTSPIKPKSKKSGRPKTGFDKLEYQRAYMRDKTIAAKEGLTVKQWRSKQKTNK